MEDTHEFVEKIHDKQAKDLKNKKHGKGNPAGQLPSKPRSTQK